MLGAKNNYAKFIQNKRKNGLRVSPAAFFPKRQKGLLDE
jgi:hypothetical protein